MESIGLHFYRNCYCSLKCKYLLALNNLKLYMLKSILIEIFLIRFLIHQNWSLNAPFLFRGVGVYSWLGITLYSVILFLYYLNALTDAKYWCTRKRRGYNPLIHSEKNNQNIEMEMSCVLGMYLPCRDGRVGPCMYFGEESSA